MIKEGNKIAFVPLNLPLTTYFAAQIENMSFLSQYWHNQQNINKLVTKQFQDENSNNMKNLTVIFDLWKFWNRWLFWNTNTQTPAILCAKVTMAAKQHKPPEAKGQQYRLDFSHFQKSAIQKFLVVAQRTGSSRLSNTWEKWLDLARALVQASCRPLYFKRKKTNYIVLKLQDHSKQVFGSLSS